MASVAFILGPEFEDSEFRHPYDHLREAGHQVEVLGMKAGEEMKGKRGKERFTIEAAAGDRDPESYAALVIPGGHAPDKLRMDENVVGFVRRFAETERPLAAICHAAHLLVEADLVRGRTLTSYPSVRTDVINAGGHWVDRELVEDGALISSRNPGDLDAFTGAILKRLP